MIQSSFRPNQTVCFRVLSDDAIYEIRRAAFDVLEKTGCKIMHKGARKISKTIDAQAGIDTTFSILAQGLAGLNLIHDVGYMDSGMVCSAEMLVLGDEVVGMSEK